MSFRSKFALLWAKVARFGPKAVVAVAKPTVLLLLLVLVFLGKNALPADGDFIGGIDVAKYSFWNALFTKAQLASGHLPLWNPYYYSGHPFVANPQTFSFYPFTLLFVLLPLPWAFNLSTIAHLFLAGAGTYCFLFAVTRSKIAAMAAAVIYCMSGYFTESLFAGHLAKLHTAALVPWIFYFVERGLKGARADLFGAAGVVFGLQILGGGTQNSVYTAIFITLYCVGRTVVLPDRKRPIPFERGALFFLLVPLVTFCTAAVQILPSAEFMTLSDRAENTYQFATYFSFPIDNLFTFLVGKPRTKLLNTNWEFGCYFGLLAMVLAVVGAVFGRLRRHAICFGIVILVAATIMLGRNTPIYRFYFDWVPGLDVFRIPSRCVLFVVFGMAALAGLGVHRMVDAPLKMRYLPVPILCAVALLGCLIQGADAFAVSWDTGEMKLALGLLIGAVVVLTASALMKRAFVTAALIVPMLFCDSYLSNSDRIPKTNQERLLRPMRYEKMFEKEPGLYRVAIPRDAPRAMHFHYYGINGRTPSCLGSYFKFMHEMAGVPIPRNRRHTLSAGIFTDKRVFSSKVLGIRYAYARGGRSRGGLVTDERAVPRAWIAKRAVVLPDLEAHLETMRRSGFDPKTEVLLERDGNAPRVASKPLNGATPATDRVAVVRYLPNQIDLVAETKAPAHLVLSELYYPGWRAYVNQTRATILRADYLLRAVKLEPGRWDISFVYRPMSLAIGAVITGLTLLLGAVYLVLSRKKGGTDQTPGIILDSCDGGEGVSSEGRNCMTIRCFAAPQRIPLLRSVNRFDRSQKGRAGTT